MQATRQQILDYIRRQGRATVKDLDGYLSLTSTGVRQHLTVLEREGLVAAQEKRGRVTWCKLDPDAMKSASVWMQGFGQFEPVNLDAFERFLTTELSDDLPDAD